MRTRAPLAPKASLGVVLAALIACGGVEYERHDTGHGLSFELPKTCTARSKTEYQCAKGAESGGTDVSVEPFALGIESLERDPVFVSRAGNSIWSGRIKAGELDAFEAGVRQAPREASAEAPQPREHWLVAVAGPKGTVLIQVTSKQWGKEAGPKRDNLFWRHLVSSIKAAP